MQLIYEGVDITDSVDIVSGVHLDAADGRADRLDMTMEHADTWFRWGPREDDELEIVHGGYRTGKLYLNAVIPEGGRFRVAATSAPSAARRKRTRCYEDMTFYQIMDECAAECRMGFAAYGMDKDMTYRYLSRTEQTGMASADWLCRMEGAVLKLYDGQFVAIGIADAQKREAVQTIALESGQEGTYYRRRAGERLRGIRLITPHADGSAQDDGADGEDWETRADLPVHDDRQAGRWAAGMLLHHNRMTETLELTTGFSS
ncbi:MAG: hypothetical protein ACI4PG_06585, partial [Candidatus Ventricola sp.]